MGPARLTRPGADLTLATWGAAGPDVAVGAIHRGETLWRAGDQEARFDLASVTKALVAWTVLVAVEEGSIALDEPAGPPGSTVRHLLAHASGLPFDGATPIAAVAKRRIYSNRGFEVLGTHLSERTGIGWAHYATAAILEPLGMRSTAFGDSPAHGAISTVADMVAFAAEVATPTLLDRSTVTEAGTVQFPTLRGVLPGIGRFNPNPWGLGIEIRGDKSPHWTGTRCSVRTLGHFGATGTFWWYDPDLDLSVVGLGRRRFGPWALEVWPGLADAIIDLTH